MSSAMPAFPTSWFRSFIIVALSASLAFVGGCSVLRISYNQAPDLLYWYLDGYVDFTSEQTPRVRDALTQFLGWHRRTQLPDYATQLARAQVEVLADTSGARVCDWQDELLVRAHTAFERAVPAIADVVMTITPQQIQHIERRQAKANAEFRDDYLQADARKRAELTLKRTVDRAETLYGKLTETQRELIAEGLSRSPFDPEKWIAERRLRQQEVLGLLRRTAAEGSGAEQVQAALKVYVQRIERSPREAYRRHNERLAEFNCAFAATLHNGMNAAQRRIAADKLAGWEGDLRALAADRPRAALAEALR